MSLISWANHKFILDGEITVLSHIIGELRAEFPFVPIYEGKNTKSLRPLVGDQSLNGMTIPPLGANVGEKNTDLKKHLFVFYFPLFNARLLKITKPETVVCLSVVWNGKCLELHKTDIKWINSFGVCWRGIQCHSFEMGVGGWFGVSIMFHENTKKQEK